MFGGRDQASLGVGAGSKALGHTFPIPNGFNKFISAQLLPHPRVQKQWAEKGAHSTHSHVTQHTAVDRPHEHITVNMSCIET